MQFQKNQESFSQQNTVQSFVALIKTIAWMTHLFFLNNFDVTFFIIFKMSVQQPKKRKSLQKANTMMGLIGAPSDPHESPQSISPLTKPPRLQENSLNFFNDIESQQSGRSGSRNKPKKEGSLLDHIKIPEPSVKLTARESSEDNKSERSKKSKKNNKDGVLFNPGEKFVEVGVTDRRDSSFEKISERSNSKSEKRKNVKQNSIFDFKGNNESMEDLLNRNHRRPEFSPMPSSLIEYSSAPSELPPEFQPKQYKPLATQTQRTNNLVRIPLQPDEQKIGTPYNPASRTSKPQVGKVSNNFSNASSVLELSSQLLSSSNNRNRERKKIFNKTNESSKVYKIPGDEQFQFSDSEEGDKRIPHSKRDTEHHMKVTQLKYSSTPPKNEEMKNDSVMFNFQQEPQQFNPHPPPAKQKRKGLNLLPREPSEDSSFDNNRSRETSRDKKQKKAKESVLLPQTGNKYFDLSAPKSPYKPNDSFYEEEINPLNSHKQVQKIISFDEDEQDNFYLKSNTIGGERGFVEKMPSMTADNFLSSDNRFDQSSSSLRYPKTKPPRSLSSKKSNGSEKSSSLLDSGMSSHRDDKRKVTLSELASQKVSQATKGKSKDKKKESTLLEFYENSSEDGNRSNASKDSRKSRNKETSLIDMNKLAKRSLENDFQYDHSKFNSSQDNKPPEIYFREDQRGRRKQMNIRDLEEVESRVITKYCYVLNQKGKAVKKKCQIQLAGKSKSKQKQPSFYQTQYGKNYIKSTSNISRRNSNQSKQNQKSKQTSLRNQSNNYGEQSGSRNRSRQKSNFNDSSLSEFYRPRQEMKHEPMKPDDFYLKHYYNDERSYTYEYYGDSEEEEVERVSFNAMFTKNNSKTNKLPRTETSASKYRSRN